jgi:cysteine synthase A
MAKFEKITDTIGNTPSIRINKIGPKGINIYGKMESFNPMSSVKDRLALGVILEGERSGELKPGQTVIEATSGNTGIGLAMVCAERGYPLVVTMAESFSIERRKVLRFLGAKVILTPAGEKGSGMLAKAVELAKEHGWFLARQFENEANPNMHSKTTAEEILADFPDGLDYFVTGFGTGGTLTGVARVLKEKSPNTKIMVCEPDNVPILQSKIPQKRDKDGNHTESHPMFRPHLMQGWAPDFIPQITEKAVAEGLIDGFVPIKGGDALKLSRRLAREEGIFVGTSAGATFAGALEVAKKAKKGETILFMLPDTGDRYLSTPLFEDIETDMNEAEMEVSNSTPRFRFGSAPKKIQRKADEKQEKVELNKKALDFFNRVTSDKNQPVVLFALEWCEFCWAVRKFFKEANIPYRAVDLDSVEYQKDDLGLNLRPVLAEKTGVKTIPQIFIGGEHIGGATEAFDAFNNGSFQKALEKSDVKFDRESELNPYSLLPKWLHPR